MAFVILPRSTTIRVVGSNRQRHTMHRAFPYGSISPGNTFLRLRSDSSSITEPPQDTHFRSLKYSVFRLAAGVIRSGTFLMISLASSWLIVWYFILPLCIWSKEASSL